MSAHSSRSASLQTLVGIAAIGLACVLAWGAALTPSEAGYTGIGPDFLPWVVSGLLFVCGGGLIREAGTGGFRQMEPGPGSDHGHWPGLIWVTAGLLLNAALLTVIGFVLSCTAGFVLSVRGFQASEGRAARPGFGSWIKDAAIGLAICAPVYWLFSIVLGIRLPGLTDSGWL